MPLTRITSKGIADSAVTEDKITNSSVSADKLSANSVNSGKIVDGAVAVADLASTLDLSPKTVTLSASTVQSLKQPVQDNIALLGFKMAVNDGLTVFNLVDGVVDEFHDESGTDEGEGSNDLYNSTSDYYINSTTPDGTPSNYSAGFSTSAITEPDTSTTATNPEQQLGTDGEFQVPTGITSLAFTAFGSGGGVAANTCGYNCAGGGGGLVTGNVAVTGGQTIYVEVGEGGKGGTPGPGAAKGGFGGDHPQTECSTAGNRRGGGDGGGTGHNAAGGGLTAISTAALGSSTPAIIAIAGSGGGGANPGGYDGGGAGGTQGYSGTGQEAQTTADDYSGGGGSQTAGGQGGPGPQGSGDTGGFLYGGTGNGGGGGGAGYYGGGGGGDNTPNPQFERGGAGGGGSSYTGHPQVTSGATTGAGPDPAGGGNRSESGGVGNPLYSSAGSVGEGGSGPSAQEAGEDGYVFLTASGGSAAATSTTIISNAFSAGSVPTTSRIVVFQENIDSPTLNTDIIASVSRDGGSNFTTATLSDSGYVTGSSGQRILTGQATISGQPSGQSMRWKLALANNQVKIHGVSLQWA